MAEGLTAYTYNAIDQMLSATDSAGKTDCRWDKAGRLSTESGTGVSPVNRVYTWSPDDHLLSVTLDPNTSTQKTITCGYDHDSNRTRRQVAGEGIPPTDLNRLSRIDTCRVTSPRDGEP